MNNDMRKIQTYQGFALYPTSADGFDYAVDALEPESLVRFARGRESPGRLPRCVYVDAVVPVPDCYDDIRYPGHMSEIEKGGREWTSPLDRAQNDGRLDGLTNRGHQSEQKSSPIYHKRPPNAIALERNGPDMFGG